MNDSLWKEEPKPSDWGYWDRAGLVYARIEYNAYSIGIHWAVFTFEVVPEELTSSDLPIGVRRGYSMKRDNEYFAKIGEYEGYVSSLPKAFEVTTTIIRKFEQK